jgi:hypothetical protein
MIVEKDLPLTETLPNGDRIDIMHSDEKTQCFYVNQDNKKLLAEIDELRQIVAIYPINTRINSDRFLEPKYNNINILFEGYNAAIEKYIFNEEMYVLSGLPEVFIKTLRFGLGIKKEYKYFIEITNCVEECKNIIISNIRTTDIDGVDIIVKDNDLDKIRRGIDRISRLYSDESLESKRLFVYNELLHNINNMRFPEKKKAGKRDIVYRIIKDIDFSKSISKSDKKSLLEIKANIDLGYFTTLKNDFFRKIKENHNESVYQNFFAENPLLLTMFVGSPYFQFNSQAYVGGKTFDNKNGQYPDFLYKHKITKNNFIIEIKRPNTPLLENIPYRKTGIYSPSKELSGSISQILTQKYQLETDIASLIKNAEDRDVEAYNVQGLILIGLLSSFNDKDAKTKKRSFELFRNNQKNLRIMTYDECQEQLNYFLMTMNKKHRHGEENDA